MNKLKVTNITSDAIELVSIVGHPVRILGHGWNNGYYSDNLDLVVDEPIGIKNYNITECQIIRERTIEVIVEEL